MIFKALFFVLLASHGHAESSARAVAQTSTTEEFSEICDQVEPNDPSVPLCPEKGGMLNETYPVMVATVSSDEGKPKLINDFVSQFINNSKRVVPIIVNSLDSCNPVYDHIQSLKLNEKQKEQWKKAIFCNTESAKLWQQDFMQGYFQPKTGRPYVRFAPTYYRGEGRRAYKGIPKILKSCGGIKISEDLPYRRDVDGGGNIEGVPPYFCIYGGGVKSQGEPRTDKEVNEASLKVCQGSEAIIAPTSFLRNDHVDEIAKTISTQGNEPCNFKVLVADTKLGMDIFKNAGDQPIFENNPSFDDLLSNLYFMMICQEWQKSEFKKQNASLPSKIKSFIDSLINRIPASEKPKKFKYDYTKCHKMTGTQFHTAVQTVYGEYNKAFNKRLNKFADKINKKVKKEN